MPGEGVDRIPSVRTLEVIGPFNASGASDTPSRQRIFVCHPDSAAPEAEQTACARKIVLTFAQRAYRIPYEGARLCHLSGVPVAWTLGRILETPVSLVVFKRSELEHFPKAKERLDSGDPIVCSKAGRYQFAVRYVNGYVVCLIGEMKRTELEAVLKTVHPSTG